MTKLIDEGLADFANALCDDLNISKALGAVFDFIREVNKLKDLTYSEAKALTEAIERIDSVLGVIEKTSVEIPPEIIEKAEQRKQAKIDKNWQLADTMRDEITKAGFAIEDMPGNKYRLKPAGD